MGQNNDTTEHGDLQGNQGGQLSKDPEKYERQRREHQGYAIARDTRLAKNKQRPDVRGGK